MAPLPTVIRRDVRDIFENPEGPLQQRLKYLNDTIGYPVRCTIDWASLWNECEPHLADKSTFVPNVASQITSFFEALASKVNNEPSPWIEQLLERIKSVQEIRVNVQVALTDLDLAQESRRQHKSIDSQASAIRFSDHQEFVLVIPSKPSVTPISSTQLLQDLDSIFSAVPNQASLEEEDDESVSDSAQSQSILTPVSSLSIASHFPTISQSSQTSIPSSVPVLSTLPRPDLLFSRNTPHIIHVRYESNRESLSQSPATTNIHSLPDRLVLQSTHQPSLKLIHDYFSKWSRADPLTREKIPLLRYTLVASCLGPGTCYDTLVVEPFSQVSARGGLTLNPSLFECFIESVLGYEVIARGNANASGGNGVFWEFRRTAAFS